MNVVLRQKERFSPFVLPRSVLRAWFSAKDHGSSLMTDDGAGLISSWKERINGNFATAITTGRPTWGAAAFLGANPGLAFDGVANALTAATITAHLPSGAVPGCTMLVHSVANNMPVNGRIVTYGVTSATRETLMEHLAFLRVTDGVVGINAPGGASFNSFQTIICEYTPTTMSAWRNGEAFAANPATIALNTTPTRLRFGAAAGTSPSGFGACTIADYMVFGELTAAQRQQLEGWAAWEYSSQASLSDSHPYKRFRP